jgi:hypothetical protein
LLSNHCCCRWKFWNLSEAGWQVIKLNGFMVMGMITSSAGSFKFNRSLTIWLRRGTRSVLERMFPCIIWIMELTPNDAGATIDELVRSRISSSVIRDVEGIVDLNDSMLIVKLIIDEFWANWWFEPAWSLRFMTRFDNNTALSLLFTVYYLLPHRCCWLQFQLIRPPVLPAPSFPFDRQDLPLCLSSDKEHRQFRSVLRLWSELKVHWKFRMCKMK